jgi:3-phytase
MEKFFSCNFSGKNIYGGLILLFIAIVSIAVFLSGAVHPVRNRFAVEEENKEQDTIHDVRAVAETTPVPRGEREDSADDPALWIHPDTPDSSRIIGTDKKGGLSVYNLEGKELFYYGDGKMNNADLRYGFELTDRTTDILAVSNRTDNSINLYAINRNGFLKKIHKRLLLTEMADEVYGLCMYKSSLNNKFYVFINNKEGDIEQWELFADENRLDGKIVRKLKLMT